MQLSFTKMHGCGNTYLYFNTFAQNIQDPVALSKWLSDVHFGVGSDGIILIGPSDKADAQMRIFNADGSEGKMCGNGIRCVGKYLYDYGMVGDQEQVTVDTLSGIKTLRLYPQGGKVQQVRVDMGAPILTPKDIPAQVEGERALSIPIHAAGKDWQGTCVSMGNPHCVIFLQEDVGGLDLPAIGPSFEHHKLFPDGVNTEFINVVGKNELRMRVWERGSGETWACGTGACASAVAAVENGLCDRDADITLHLRGGDLTIRYTKETVWMTGPASTICEGKVEV